MIGPPLKFPFPKDPVERIPLTFDFGPDLATGVTLSGTPTIVQTSVFSGTDVPATTLVLGTPAIDATSTQVVVPSSAGTLDCAYQITIECPTTDPNTTLALTALLEVARDWSP